MNNETALERFTEIKDSDTLNIWLEHASDKDIISDIQELVSLANNAPNIDAMRFEAAAKLMAAMLSDPAALIKPLDYAKISIQYTDALIAEFKKKLSHDNNTTTISN